MLRQSLTRRNLLQLGAVGSWSLATGASSESHSAEMPPSELFLVKPYVQLGDAPHLLPQEQLEILWHSDNRAPAWRVEWRVNGGVWNRGEEPRATTIATAGIPPHRVWQSRLTGLPPGERVEYQVVWEGTVVFAAAVRARPPRDRGYRCVVMGDCGTGSLGQRLIAARVHAEAPDLVMIPGDIVYNNGRISEYRSSFFPVYSAHHTDPAAGAPLLSSTLFLAGLGQHDTESNLQTQPDGFAYYYYWSQPRNGPVTNPDSPLAFPLAGTEAQRQAFLQAAAGRYPCMSTFSCDFGNTHWTILDTFNPHADWNSAPLRDWLRRDLAGAQNARWRFVCCYLPPFNSCRQYPQGEKMRAVTDLFEEYGVDLVFSGFAHSYQRTRPLRFRPDSTAPERAADWNQQRPGDILQDRVFDGLRHTHPQGVIYIVTGGGGHPGLHGDEQTDAGASWQPFTVRYHARQNHFTVLEVQNERVALRQMGADGSQIDSLFITREG